MQATGVPREQLIGTDSPDYFTEPDKAREGYRRVFAEGFVRDYPLALRHVSGRVTDVLYNAGVYRDEQGHVLGVFAAARDITERKQAAATLRQLNEQLEQRVRERTAQLEAANQQLRQEMAERKQAGRRSSASNGCSPATTIRPRPGRTHTPRPTATWFRSTPPGSSSTRWARRC